jgi:hypothetical protein
VQSGVGEEVVGEQLPSGYRVISDRAVESIDDARAKRPAVQAPSEDRLVAADRVYSNGRRGPTPAQAEAHEMIETKQTTRLQPAKSGGSVMRTKDAAPNWPKADSLMPANMEPISEQDAANW